MDLLKIKLCQLNSTVGDIEGNFNKVCEQIEIAAKSNVDLVVYPEFFLTGYPPEDLVINNGFLNKTQLCIEQIALRSKEKNLSLIISAPFRANDKIYNAIHFIQDGAIRRIIPKIHLPNYSVFDEKRLFAAGEFSMPIEIKGTKLGVMTCEDVWYSDVSAHLRNEGAKLLIAINASPFEMCKLDRRINLVKERANETKLPLLYLNLVGGQDELVFDGNSFVVDNAGNIITVMKNCVEECIDLKVGVHNNLTLLEPISDARQYILADKMAEIYTVLVLGLRDYVRKNNFQSVVLGLSGGIDSALTAAIAVDALGAENVRCVRLPSMYSSDHSLSDAAENAKLLGCKLDTVNIEGIYGELIKELEPIFHGYKKNVTEENLQARIRGVILMALSNKFNELLITTGNKSEVAVGYATLYGDMCGGYSVLKDVYKTTVYKLSNWRNQNWVEGFNGPKGIVIPKNSITKEPSAELRDNQKDSDSLPSYDVLDAILKMLIEGDKSIEEIVVEGFDKELVIKIKKLLYLSEYKRRQSAPGVKISTRDLAKDRRYPISNGYRG